MPQYMERDFRLGDYWLSQQSRSPAWCRTWFDGQSRQTKRQSLGTSDYEEAKQLLTEWFIVNHQSEGVSSQECDLASVLVRYWEEQGKKARSAVTIRGHLGYWSSFFAEKSVAEATEYRSLEAFKEQLARKGLSAASINRVLAAGKAALRLSWKQGELSHVPPIQMVPVGAQEPMGRPLTVAECARLLRAARAREASHVAMFIELAIGTAARPGAILELTYEQLDFEHRLIHLNPRGRAQNKKLRPSVKMPERIAEVVSGARVSSTDVPVVAYNGKFVRSLKTSWRKIRLQAGLDEGVTTYSFRHTIARHMRSEGVPAWEVAAQLGHKTAGVTDRYAPFSPDYLNQAVAAIDGFFERVACELRVNA